MDVELRRTGRNLTPDKLRFEDRKALASSCDRALRRLTEYLGVTHVVGVGIYAEKRAREALKGLDVENGRILHPSQPPMRHCGLGPRRETVPGSARSAVRIQHVRTA